jgi:magnesium transporter
MEARLISPAGVASLSMTEIRDVAARDGGTLWLDFDHTDEDSMELLGELIDVRAGDIQECHKRSPVPKMRFYADHHFSAINGLARGADGRLRFQPLKLFLTPRALVTVLGPTSSSLTSEIARRELAAVRQRIDSGQLRPASSFELVGAIRAEEMQTHEDLIAESSARIAQLERDVSQKDPVKAEALLDDLFDLRHDLEAIRTSAA